MHDPQIIQFNLTLMKLIKIRGRKKDDLQITENLPSKLKLKLYSL